MYRNFKIVKIDAKYCNYLRNFDKKVSYNAGIKKLRPFIGVLFKINDIEYFAPLSSPKEKHKKLKNSLDLIKINNAKYGVINFNNMIPVTKENYELFDLNKKTDDKDERLRIVLMKKQLRWLNANKKLIYNKSKILYNLYKNNKLPLNIKDRCCNFLLLEEKCYIYNKNNLIYN